MTTIDLFLSIYDILLHDHEFVFSVKANSGTFYLARRRSLILRLSLLQLLL